MGTNNWFKSRVVVLACAVSCTCVTISAQASNFDVKDRTTTASQIETCSLRLAPKEGAPAFRRSKFVEKYALEIGEFRRARKSGIPVMEIKLTATQNFKKTLDQMRAELFEIRESQDYLANEYLSAGEKAKAEPLLMALLADLNQMMAQDKISYAGFLEIGYRYEAATMLKHLRQVEVGLTSNPQIRSPMDVARTNFGLAIEFMSKKNAGSKIPDLLGVENGTEVYFRLPSFTTLGFRSFNESLVYHVAPVGLSGKINYVDGAIYVPIHFFLHDIGHIGSLKDKFKDHVIEPEERIAFYKKFDEWSQSDGIDSLSDRLRMVIWFYAFHEASLPLHPQAMKEALTAWRSPSAYWDINNIVKRLNDKKSDFGMAFKNEQISKEAVETEIDHILNFLSSV